MAQQHPIRGIWPGARRRIRRRIRRVALGKEVGTAPREEPNGSVLSPMLEGSRAAPPALHATPLPPGEEPTAASLRDVLRNRHFRSLWLAQICSQLAQNLTWIILGAFVRQQTKQTTLVAVIIVSAMLAQLFLSGFAGVLVDRASKRGVLFSSNVLRVILTLLFIATTPLTVAVQASLAGSLREAARHVVGDVREALRLLSRDPGLSLTIFQINLAPTFIFV